MRGGGPVSATPPSAKPSVASPWTAVPGAGGRPVAGAAAGPHRTRARLPQGPEGPGAPDAGGFWIPAGDRPAGSRHACRKRRRRVLDRRNRPAAAARTKNPSPSVNETPSNSLHVRSSSYAKSQATSGPGSERSVCSAVSRTRSIFLRFGSAPKNAVDLRPSMRGLIAIPRCAD